jgi:hypothetical protein
MTYELYTTETRLLLLEGKKGEYRAVRTAMTFVVAALLVYIVALIWAPPFAWWVNLILVILAWVLAVFSVLAVVDLPDNLTNLHNWLWNDNDKPRVKRVRKLSFWLFVATVVISWVFSIVLMGLAGLSGDNGGSADPGQRSPGSSQSAGPSTSSSPSTSPSPSAPNCGAPELRVISTEAMKDTRFSPLGVERCVDGRWEDWGTSSAPDTIRIHRENWHSDGYYYFLFSHDGENVVARTKATR